MRCMPENTECDQNELEILKAEPWQVELLSYNPEYVFWGNFEDYMCKDDSGWDSRCGVESPDQLWELDDLNECVNFYFKVYRKNHTCKKCEGSGLNPETKKLSDDWYSFDKSEYINIGEGRRYNNCAWQYHLTEVEIKALVEANRLYDFTRDFVKGKGWVKKEPEYIPTPEEVNEWAKKGIGHDSINQWVCVEARAKKLGVYGHCKHCVDGVVYDESKAKVALQLWVIHPRKGCSRGIYVKEVKRDHLDKVFKYLTTARDRNNERFSKIPVKN